MSKENNKTITEKEYYTAKIIELLQEADTSATRLVYVYLQAMIECDNLKKLLK